ncbi:hypothetical protein CYMTET_27824 [Cymbomonas tetramitiformis]|uniref:Rhodanese domain-containing protein n=1 Tax=Cymbomonas tetramitiformis TaxID=36881 RepID=A0AAE0FPF4_9CHLO|nr:hypothetical protein CYMTET_27824 [Cymbomonas tetramitiformis]
MSTMMEFKPLALSCVQGALPTHRAARHSRTAKVRNTPESFLGRSLRFRLNLGTSKQAQSTLGARSKRSTVKQVCAQVGFDVYQMVDASSFEASVKAVIATSAVGLAGTFFLAPRARDKFKEEFTWREIQSDLIEQSFNSLTANELQDMLNRGEDLIVLDVRAPSEYRRGYIGDSWSAPLYRPIQNWDAFSNIRRAAFGAFGSMGSELDPEWLTGITANFPKGSDSPMVVYCAMGGSLDMVAGRAGIESR